MEKLLFDGFHEPPINFPPTYKFDIGSNEYDTSEKQRVPAYTDRILYLYHDTAYGALKLDVDCLSYRSHPSYMISDHRPVTATIAISVPEKPIHGPITFDIQVGRRSREMARKFRYKIRKDFVTAADDWIAIFKADFAHFDCYLKYQWAAQAKYLTSVDRMAIITFTASQIAKLEDDTYVLCYLTRNGSLCGISSEFEIVSGGTH